MRTDAAITSTKKLQKRIQRRRVLRDSWPLLVWIAMVSLAVWAFKTGGEFHRLRGIVTKQVDIVASPLTSGLVEIPADIPEKAAQGDVRTFKQGDWVEAGWVVAKLDDTVIVQEIEAEVQKARMEFTLKLVTAWEKNDAMTRELLSLKEDIRLAETNLAVKKRLEATIRAQVKVGEATLADVAAVESEIIELENQKETFMGLLEEAKKSLKTGNDVIERLRKEAEVLENREQNEYLKWLEAQRAQTIIRANRSGRVERVLKLPGDVVKAGDPIMEILVEQERTVTALIPEEHALTMKDPRITGKPEVVYISIPNQDKQFVEANIVSMAPGMTQLPDLGSPIRGRMNRGRLVELGNLDETFAARLIPGSEVIISLEKPGRFAFLSWFVE